jgi:hypothetical protein
MVRFLGRGGVIFGVRRVGVSVLRSSRGIVSAAFRSGEGARRGRGGGSASGSSRPGFDALDSDGRQAQAEHARVGIQSPSYLGRQAARRAGHENEQRERQRTMYTAASLSDGDLVQVLAARAVQKAKAKAKAAAKGKAKAKPKSKAKAAA